MLVRRFLIGICFALLAGPAAAQDDSFTSADVLTWDREGQDALFASSLVMAGIAARQTQVLADRMTCINDLNAGDARQQTNDSLRGLLERFPDLHPQAVIMAFIERECGSFAIN